VRGILSWEPRHRGQAEFVLLAVSTGNGMATIPPSQRHIPRLGTGDLEVKERTKAQQGQLRPPWAVTAPCGPLAGPALVCGMPQAVSALPLWQELPWFPRPLTPWAGQ
jgi:hypothetical protein